MSDKVIPVKVALRIRPLINKEICDGCRECIEVVPNEQQVTIGCGNEKAFTYDYVFGPTSQQRELYDNAVEPLLETFFNGYNATVLAYGQTGSGKTYSMGTCATMNASESVNDVNEEIDNGVIPKVIKELFYRIENLKQKYDFLVKISFLEIHNEEIKDLLLGENVSDEKSLAIRENTSGEIKITGLQEVKVASVDDMATCLEKGSSARATGATAMNTRSSRSHAIFTITMEQREKAGSRDFKKAKFHLVDLAGSERAKKTQASGERFKEGININKGLLSLGNVISALGDEQRKSHAHVPYRDSKLTRLLQDSLGGNSNTVMIACVSPADSNMEETLNTLKYADRARKIKNKPVVNRDPAAAELSKLRQQVQMLQLQLLEGQYIHQDGSSVEVGAEMHEILERNRQLEGENEKLTSELHEAVDQTTALHEKIMLVELSKDKLKQKSDKLKDKILSRGLDVSFDLDEDKENIETIDIVKHIQMKVEELNDSEEQIAETSEVAVTPEDMEHESGDVENLRPEIANSSFAAQHALRKAELSKQLQELTKALTMKEEIASKMVDNDSRLTAIRKQHEMTVKDLEHVIEKLEKEKFQLNTALNASKSNPSTNKKERERLRELETQLNELRKKQVEYQRLQKSKEQGDAKITKLDAEIRGMKQMKVKLMRQMKEESEKFRQWKLIKDKEINQLKQQGRKRQFEYKKLESVHLKQQAVLRRKTEEAAAANKRLKAALSKQKEAMEKRSQSMYNQNKQSESVLERMKSWLTHEVEVMVSSGEARNALKEIIEDRKTLSQEISALKSKLQSKMDEPSNKKISLGGSEISSVENCEVSVIRKQIQTLEIDLEVRSSQIAELQQKIIDAEQGERTKYRWNNVHTMAEAKAGLRVLLNWVIEAKLAQGQLRKEKEDCSRLSLETGSELEQLKSNYENKIASMVTIHQKERTVCLNQQEEQVTKLLDKIEEQKSILESMEELQAENTNLKERLEEVSKVLRPEKKVKKHVKKNTQGETMTIAELDMVINLSEADPMSDCDSDYIPTPIQREKKRNERKSAVVNKRKRISKIFNNVCTCKGNCNSRRCRCKGGNKHCVAACQCSNTTCLNRSEETIPSSPVIEPQLVAIDESVAKSPVSSVPAVVLPVNISSDHHSPAASPLTANSPKILHPGKTTIALKSKSSRRRSVKHLSNNTMKKLLSNSKSSSSILTPSKHFVAPMSIRRPFSSGSKVINRAKPLVSKNDGS